MNAMCHHGAKFFFALVLGAVLVPSLSRAGERPEAEPDRTVSLGQVKRSEPDPKSDEIYLIEKSQRVFKVVKTIDLPSRVYLKKSAVLGKYQSFITTRRGKLTTPERYLLSGSIVRGDRMGGEKDTFYVLAADGGWRRVQGPDELYYVKDDNKLGAEAIMTPSEQESAPPSSVASTTSTH